MRSALTAITLLTTSTSTPARTWHINPEGSGDFPTIQAAIDASVAQDVIELADGVYTGKGNWGVVVRKAIVIRSQSGDPTRCIIDGASGDDYTSGIEIHATASPPVLHGITVTGARLDEWSIGGALLIWSSSPIISNCVLSENVAGQSAAIHVQWSSAVFKHCVIVRNTATRFGGGGAFCGLEAFPTFLNCTIADNSGPTGAGLWVYWNSEATITHSIITGNYCTGNYGGDAVECDVTSSCVLDCSDVFGNPAGDWTGCIADQARINGNFSADPLFCDAEGGDFTLSSQSPCLPGSHPDGVDCGLIGALGQGCGTVSVEQETWAEIKARYRR